MSEQTQKRSATQVILGKLEEAISKLQALMDSLLHEGNPDSIEIDECIHHIDILCSVLYDMEISETDRDTVMNALNNLGLKVPSSLESQFEIVQWINETYAEIAKNR